MVRRMLMMSAALAVIYAIWWTAIEVCSQHDRDLARQCDTVTLIKLQGRWYRCVPLRTEGSI